MAELVAPPVLMDTNTDTDGVAGAAPVPAAAPQEPEVVSETLYIQNLNEKIRIPGASSSCSFLVARKKAELDTLF